jgi:formate dehydrogenase maturation protein FdhE
MPLSIHFARQIVHLLSVAVEYYNGTGARCPLCGSIAKVTSVNCREATFIRRYHKCKACLSTFASIEHVEVVVEHHRIETIQKVDVSAAVCKSKGRKSKKARASS